MVPDGQLDIGTYGQINMANLQCGATYFIYVKNHRLLHLEIAVNGNGHWDGTEADWQICDPDTGEF
jgi:hypothetical protein